MHELSLLSFVPAERNKGSSHLCLSLLLPRALCVMIFKVSKRYVCVATLNFWTLHGSPEKPVFMANTLSAAHALVPTPSPRTGRRVREGQKSLGNLNLPRLSCGLAFPSKRTRTHSVSLVQNNDGPRNAHVVAFPHNSEERQNTRHLYLHFT